jgi:uncharacterized RDD family membrane protein YckC
MNDPNPYAPAKPTVVDPAAPAAGPNTLATRTRRAWADTLDTVIALIWVVPLWSHFKVVDNLLQGEFMPLSVEIEIGALSFVMFALANAWFLARNGQTIGKMLLGIRIATLDGGVPELWRTLALRYAPIAIVSVIPTLGLGLLLPTVDVLFIFRGDRRCVHDMIAGTQVLRVSRARN